jgi:hypothetical protein
MLQVLGLQSSVILPTIRSGFDAKCVLKLKVLPHGHKDSFGFRTAEYQDPGSK